MKDLSLNYLAGKLNFPAILLMHSLGDDCHIMAPLAKSLNELGYAVLSPTFTSHETGEFETIFAASFAEYQADGEAALAWLQAQGHKDIFVGGLSLGGLVAIDLACQHPEIKGLICLATPMFTDLNHTQVPYFIRQKYYASLGHVPSLEERQAAKAQFEVFQQSLKTINRWMDQVLNQVLQLKIPTFVGIGDQDEVMQVEVGRRLARALRQAVQCDLQIYIDGSHYLVAEPTFKAVLADLNQFLTANH